MSDLTDRLKALALKFQTTDSGPYGGLSGELSLPAAGGQLYAGASAAPFQFQLHPGQDWRTSGEYRGNIGYRRQF